jgi:hypothetical protein
MAPGRFGVGCAIHHLSASGSRNIAQREAASHALETPHGVPGKVLQVLFLAAVPLLAQQAAPPDSSPSALDIQQAKALVTKFCTAWKALKLDSMYVMLSEAAKANMSREHFDSAYGATPDKSGRLLSWKVKEATGGEGGVVVKVELRFARERPPTAVNGVHGFHMVKGDGKWQVKAIVPPIRPPDGEHGGSAGHPGE